MKSRSVLLTTILLFAAFAVAAQEKPADARDLIPGQSYKIPLRREVTNLKLGETIKGTLSGERVALFQIVLPKKTGALSSPAPPMRKASNLSGKERQRPGRELLRNMRKLFRLMRGSTIEYKQPNLFLKSVIFIMSLVMTPKRSDITPERFQS